MPTWLGYDTPEEAAAKKAAAEKADLLAKQQIEIVRRKSETVRFENEQLSYRLSGKLAEVAEKQETANKHAFLTAKKPASKSVEQVEKKTGKAEEGVVAARAFTFIGSKMFQNRVVTRKKQEQPVAVESPNNIAPK